MDIDGLKEALNSYISRIVAFVVTPLLMMIAPAVTALLNEVLGLGATEDQIVEFGTALAVGIALMGATWLYGRGRFERAAVEAVTLYDATVESMKEGREHLADYKPETTAIPGAHVSEFPRPERRQD